MPSDTDKIVSSNEEYQLICRSGPRKPKLENLAVNQWSVANIAILHKLVQKSTLPLSQVFEYMNAYDLVSVYMFDREYRRLQHAHNNIAQAQRYAQCVLQDHYRLAHVMLCEKRDDDEYHKKACIERKCSRCGMEKIRKLYGIILDDNRETPCTWKRWFACKETNPKTGKLITMKKLEPQSGTVKELVAQLSAEVSLSHNISLLHLGRRVEQSRSSWPNCRLRSVSRTTSLYCILAAEWNSQGAHGTTVG